MRILYGILIGVLLTLALPAAAQSNLTAGMTVSGQSGAQYQLSASTGDLIILQAIGISPNFTPVLTLMDPNEQQVAQAQSDPLTPGTTTLAYRVSASGIYTLTVSGLNGASGQFVLTLTGTPFTSAQTLASGSSSLQVNSTIQTYLFSGPAEISLSADSLLFSAEIRDGNGQIVAQVDGVPQAAVEIDAKGSYEMTLSAASPGHVTLTYTQRPDLASTEQVTALATAAATALAVPATALVPTETLAPTITPTPSATASPTATPLPPTATLTPAPTATATLTPSPTPTIQTAATVTPAATPQLQNAQIAPRDNSYQAAISLGNAFTSSDVVSYPKGDQEDTVFYTVSGLNTNANGDNGKAELQVTALCNGTGTQFIDIAVGKQTFHCGDIIIDRTVTYATRSGSIRIAATGGSATYVQWELIGSATPIRSGG